MRVNCFLLNVLWKSLDSSFLLHKRHIRRPVKLKIPFSGSTPKASPPPTPPAALRPRSSHGSAAIMESCVESPEWSHSTAAAGQIEVEDFFFFFFRQHKCRLSIKSSCKTFPWGVCIAGRRHHTPTPAVGWRPPVSNTVAGIQGPSALSYLYIYRPSTPAAIKMLKIKPPKLVAFSPLWFGRCAYHKVTCQKCLPFWSEVSIYRSFCPIQKFKVSQKLFSNWFKILILKTR